jgi:hypothetical protein
MGPFALFEEVLDTVEKLFERLARQHKNLQRVYMQVTTFHTRNAKLPRSRSQAPI